MVNGINGNTAKVIAEAQGKSDPSLQFPGMPPNMGGFAVPQIFTLSGISTNFAKAYYPSDEALRNSWENARIMLQDCGISECVDARRRATALLKWHLEPEDPDSPAQANLCNELTRIMRRMPRFMQARDMMLQAVWYGNYGVQCKYGWKKVGDHMRVLPVEFLPIHGDKLVFGLQDGTRNAGRVGIRVGNTPPNLMGDFNERVEATSQGRAYFLKDYERRTVIIHKHMVEDGAFEDPIEAGRINGVGVRSKIYWDWFMKQQLLGMMMEYAERSALGFEIWYYPMGNPAAKAAMQTAANERITSNGRNIILAPRSASDDPQQSVIEHWEPGMAGMAALQSLLTDYFGHRIKRYILGQTLTSEADGPGLGAGAVATVHLATFLDIVRYDATLLEETITTDLVEPLQQFNFPESLGCHIRFVIETESEDVEARLSAFEKAWNMGCSIPEKDVMEAISVSMPTGPEVVLRNKAAAPGAPTVRAIADQMAEGFAAELADIPDVAE